jgi:hypothetical protein
LLESFSSFHLHFHCAVKVCEKSLLSG